MIRQSSFHSGRDAKSLVDATEIIVREPQGNRSRMILYLLGKRISKSGESPDAHSHRKVLPLYETSTHMLGIGIAAHNLHVAANALRRGVSRFIVIRRTVNLLQLRVIT